MDASLRQSNPRQAWESAKVGGREAFTRRLTAEELKALRDLTDATRHLAPDAIPRAQFSAPAIDALMREVSAEVNHGHGAVILSGLPMEGLSLDDFTRLHWGLGTHLGEGVIQNVQHDKIVQVRNDPGSPTGVTADFELRPHSEFHELLSLATFSLPQSGGVSGFVSGAAIHARMAQSHPHLLPALYEGYWQVSPVTRRMSSSKVPVFSSQGGVDSVFFNRLFSQRAAEARGEDFPTDYKEAVAVFGAYANDPDIAAWFTLQPGEQLFWNNYINLHARTAFVDSEAHKRLLLRLWMRSPEPRPVVDALAERADEADRDYAGTWARG
jgi:hypothetical protein